MIRELCKDVLFLSRKAEDAGKEDVSVAQDLLDTLKYHEAGCVGMAANMIGVNKRIIAVCTDDGMIAMINPKIVCKSEETYETEEGCLCHDGTRPVTRHKKIKVEYLNMKFRPKTKTFTDFPAQIIQHEMDHLEGILI